MLKHLFLAALVGSAFGQGNPGLQVKHEGTPTGTIKKVNGIDVYHAFPKGNATTHAVLFLTDIFGLALPQNRLLADTFADAGYLVVLPDYFKGEPIPVNMAGFDRNGWFARHPPAEIEALTASTIKYMREELKVQKIGAVGYCFGGKYVASFSAKGKGLDAGYVAHPSNVQSAEWQAVDVPFSIAAAETDGSFNITTRYQTEEVFVKKNATYQINVYSGTQHGFAIRVDMKNPRQAYGKESAFFQALQWFDQWLKGGAKSTSAGRLVENSNSDLRLEHDLENSF